MKTLLRLVCAVVILGVGIGRAAERTFVVDTVHSGVGFRIRHLYTMFPGRLNRFSGTIVVDTDDLSTLKIRAKVDMSSIDTGNQDRDTHLRNPDFFDVETYPEATFESTVVTPGEDHALTIRGILEFRGIRAEIVFNGTILGYGEDHRGGKRAGFHGVGTMDRTRFGVVYNRVLETGLSVLGDQVELVLDIEAIEVDDLPDDEPESLSDQLAAMKAAGGRTLPPEVVEALAQAKADIEKQGGVSGLTIGEAAPDFSLPDVNGNRLVLSELLKKGPVVLMFYRGEWCPFCNLQMHAMEQAYPDIRKLGASLVAISPQKLEKSIAQESQSQLSFPLLSDLTGDTMAAYKLSYSVPPEMRTIYKERFGIDLEEHNGPGRWQLPVTATYVIDAEGIVKAGVVDLDYTKRMEPADILSALADLKKP